MKYIIERTYKPVLVRYLSRARTYVYKDIKLRVPPQVFHPGFFTSTKLLLHCIRNEKFKNREFLELGAGSGLLSIYAARRGAVVTSSDINPVAVDCLRENAAINRVHLNIIQSDLFQQIPHQRFDLVVINPPYYKRTPVTPSDYAWFCGENGEYFQNLFRTLGNYVYSTSRVLMVLCDGCDLEMIRNFALEYSFKMELQLTRHTLLEKNYIFRIHKDES